MINVVAGADNEDARAVAYQIVCLAEHNMLMQQVGFDRPYSDRARQLAGRLVDELRASTIRRYPG